MGDRSPAVTVSEYGVASSVCRTFGWEKEMFENSRRSRIYL